MPIYKKLDKQIQYICIMECHLKIKKNELLKIYGNRNQILGAGGRK